jgi:hypothetical protein
VSIADQSVGRQTDAAQTQRSNLRSLFTNTNTRIRETITRESKSITPQSNNPLASAVNLAIRKYFRH